MELAFYKGKGVGGRWKIKALHKAISIISSPHTHVEGVFNDGTCFSSEFGIGARFDNHNFSNSERWTFVKLNTTLAQENRIFLRANQLVKLRIKKMGKYDTRGAIGCAWTGKENPWNWFCSEIIFEVIHRELHLPACFNKIHPQKLLELIEALQDGR